MENQKNNYLLLAFEQAKINLGSTKNNPSVGCIIEKNGSVISSSHTSFNGRPHAEYNALNKNIDFKNANLYVTLEPCTHYGLTPPCTNIIIKKKIKNVYFSAFDYDLRTRNKSKRTLNKNKISVRGPLLKKKGLDFYQSYYLQHHSNLPFIDGKIAISNDYFTKNIKNKWITNKYSRKRAHLLRTHYNCIISTSKSINDDNALLNCRIEGLEYKSPDLIIIDRNLKLKKRLNLFNSMKYRKILLFTNSNNKKKILILRKKGIRVIKFTSLNDKRDFQKFFIFLKKKGYSRILIESGLNFVNFLIKYKFLKNIYIFKSKKNLKKHGRNFASKDLLKKINLKNLISVNLFGDKLFKEKLY